MIDHIGFSVSDIERSKAFYVKALAPLGYTLLREYLPHAVGFGAAQKPDFWIGASPGKIGSTVHIAILAETRGIVRAFYDAALAAGGRDNGPPGVREMYHPHYYGAFVLDPDGHNIEAVCHLPYLG